MLENITTHKHTEIDFQSGINVFAGNNGTGKSSVLKMIGFALFDHLPGKQGDYIRKSPEDISTGKVTIWFWNDEGEQFKVERWVGQSRFRVTSLPSGRDLSQIKTMKDYRQWLKEQIALNQDLDLATLFQNAIGVDQGMFTAPFLSPASNRKRIFAPLLNVEVYQKAYQKYREIEKQFEDEIYTLNLKIEKLEGELSFKDEYFQEFKDSTSLIETLKQKFQSSQRNYATVATQLKDLKEVKKKLDLITNEFEALRIKLESLEDKLQANQSQLKEAKKAQEICLQNKRDFDQYKLLKKNLAELELKYKAFQQIEQKILKLNQKKQKIEIGTQEKQKRIDAIHTDEKKFPELERKFKQYNELQDRIGKNRANLAKIESFESRYTVLTKKEKQFRLKIEILLQETSQLSQMQHEVELREEFEKKLIIIRKKITQNESQISQYTENKTKSKNGNCPFLEERCKNIGGGSLEKYFQEKIDVLQKELREYQTNQDDIAKKIQEMKKTEKSIEKLTKKAIQREEYQNQINEMAVEIKTLKTQIASKMELTNNLNTFTLQKEKLEGAVKNYHILKEKITQELPKLEKMIDSLQEPLKLIQLKLTPLEKERSSMKDVESQLDAGKKSLKLFEQGYENYQANIKQATQLKSLEAEQTQIKTKIANLSKNFKEKNALKLKLEKNFDSGSFSSLEKKQMSLANVIGSIEGELKQKQKNRANLERKILNMRSKAKNHALLLLQRQEIYEIMEISQEMRNWYKEAGPKITEALLNTINEEASNLYRQLVEEEALEIEWQKDYDVQLRTPENSRQFFQLSGGEQMLVALSLRLAILEILTQIDFAFFDEPTTNLDPEKRKNLAQCIQKIRGFEQIFVISHDDTFQHGSDYIIQFEKEDAEISHVSSINPL